MNPQPHRLIFNKSRGCFMAVGENARSNAGGGCSGAGRSKRQSRSQRFAKTKPNSALYQLRARAPGGYVIETAPEFKQQRQWPSAPQRVAGLIGAGGVNIEVDGSVFNSGTLAARDGLSLKAGDITNILGQITAGDVTVDASGSFHNILGDLAARENLRLRAGGDLMLMAYDTGSRTSAQSQPVLDEEGNDVSRGPKWSFENSTYQQTGVQIQTGGSLSAQAGGNLVAQGVRAQAGGDTTLKAGGDMSLVTALQGRVQSFDYYFKDKTWGGLYNVATTIEQRDIDLVNSGNNWDVASLDMSAGGKLVLQGAQVNAAKGISAYGGTGYEERAAYDVKEKVNNVRTRRTGLFAYVAGSLSNTQIKVINESVLGKATKSDLTNQMDVQKKDIDSTRTAKVTTLDGGSGSVQRSTGGDAFIEGSVVKGASVGTLTAGGKVEAVGAMDTRHVEKSTYSRSLFWQKTESEGYIQQTLHLPKIHGLAPGAGRVSVSQEPMMPSAFIFVIRLFHAFA